MLQQLLPGIDMAWVYYTLASLYVITIVLTLCVVVSENRNPVKSLAWVTVLLLLPAVGMVLYMFFGRSIKNKRMISRRNRRRLKRGERARSVDLDKLGADDNDRRLIKLSRSLCGAVLYAGNDIEIFTDGRSKFDALLRDIAGATRSINLQYYIFEDDALGNRVADALIERARAGVKVRIIYDHVGSFHVRNRFFKRMRRAGIEAYPFFKVTFPLLGTRINWRNHRKIAVIDDTVGYIGGMNVANRYVDGGKSFDVWRDTHLRITGRAVRALKYSFAVDWNFMGQPLIDADEAPAGAPTVSDPHTTGVQLIPSGPTDQWNNVAHMFLQAIGHARRRVYIQTPYFLPTEGLLKALQTAALSGVDVRVMMPMRTDSRMLRDASFSYVTECLKSGIKFYLYRPGMLHAKTLIVDDSMTSVGSTNFDFRSFEHNFEANVFVYSREFNARMSAIFAADQQQCRRIVPSEWRNRPRLRRVTESLLRLLAPVL